MNNEHIGKIRFCRRDSLGSGQFGSVFRGTYDKSVNVAVRRVVHKDFLVELEVLRRAETHPNIPVYYGSDRDVEFVFIATELHVGSLKSLFRGCYSGPPITDLREALRQITSGLAHLHSKKIIHRNLRPSNILICCGPSGPLMKLANFGILRRAKPGDLTLWKLAGSKGWLPAETYTLDRFTYAMDLFALGCVFGYTLNGGVHPFGQDRDERIVRIKYSQPMTMTARDLLNVSGAVGVFQLIKLMINVDAKRRPSATEVLKHTFFICSPINTVGYEPLSVSSTSPQQPGLATAAKKSKRVEVPFEELTVSLVKPKKAKLNGENIINLTQSGSTLLSPVSDSSIVLPDSTTTLVVDMTTNNEEELTISSSFSNHTSPTINRPSSTSVSIVLVAKQTPEKKEHPTIVKVPAKNVSSPSPVPFKPKQTVVSDVELEPPTVTNSGIKSSEDLNGNLPPADETQISENAFDSVSLLHHIVVEKERETTSAREAEAQEDVNTENHQRTLNKADAQDEDGLNDSVGNLVIDESREEEEAHTSALESLITNQELHLPVTQQVNESRPLSSAEMINDTPLSQPGTSRDSSLNSSIRQSSSNEEQDFTLQLEDSSTSVDTSALTIERETPSRRSVSRRSCKTEQEQFFDLCKNQKWNGSKIAEFRRLAMNENVNVNTLDAEGLAPLLILCWKQSSELLKLLSILLERPDLQIDVTDGGEWNALVMACRHCYSKNLLGVVRLLLERGIQVNNKNSEGDNALIVLTANYKHPNLIDIIRLLIHYRIDLTTTNSLGWTAILSLTRNHTKEGLIDLVQVLLDAGIETGSIDGEGNHALLHVCANYRRESLIDLVRLFVHKCRIDVRVTNSKNWDALYTLIRYYRGYNLLEIMKILIAAGADVNQLTEDGWNSFLCLCSQQYLHEDFIAMAQLLIQSGAEINIKDEEGCHSLIFVCSNYKGDRLIEVLQLLLDHGAQVNACTTSGWNALVFLSRNHKQNDRFIDATRLLRKYGLHVEAKENDGWNLLHFLCHTPARKNLLKTVRFLLNETDIERDAVDRWGRRPVDYFPTENPNPANKSDMAEIVKLLSKRSK